VALHDVILAHAPRRLQTEDIRIRPAASIAQPMMIDHTRRRDGDARVAGRRIVGVDVRVRGGSVGNNSQAELLN
jgi:hypothetical protein